MRRDDFKAAVIHKLKGRAGHACSNPICRAPTSAAKASDDEGVLNDGVAAHICAAAPCGPRYDSAMSPQQRSSIKNGIWLCQTCARVIDSDVSVHPVELLHEWKREAEALSRKALGQRQPSPTAAQDLLVSALTGSPLKSQLAKAIENVHGAAEKAMGQIDPRFEVTSNHSDGLTTFHVQALENVPLQMTVDIVSGPNYVDGYRKLVEEGRPLKIDTAHLKIKGSPLFDEIVAGSRGGNMVITPETKRCLVKMSAVDPHSSIVESYEDVHGELAVGSKAAFFRGASMDGTLEVEMTKEHFVKGKFFFTIKLNVDKWHGLPVSALPYFNKLYKLYTSLQSGWSLNISLEYQGDVAVSGSSDFAGQIEDIHSVCMFLRYISNARTICRFIDRSVNFDMEYDFLSKDLKLLDDLGQMVNFRYVRNKENLLNAVRFNITYDRKLDQIKLLSGDVPLALRIQQASGDDLSIFGQIVQLPPRTLKINNAKTVIIDRKNKYRNGDRLRIEIVPLEGFTLEQCFEVSEEVKEASTD